MDQGDITGDHPRNSPEKPVQNSPPNGRVMVISVVICFIALLIIAFFHLYTRLYWGRRRRRYRTRRRQAWAREQTSTARAAANGGGGLPPEILKALPTFQYSETALAGEAECAVCLSEFEDGETGRVLPDCKHWFHVECIDMWFVTHSSCPLCRAPVEPIPGGLIALPTVWSPFIRDPKLLELTSIRVEAPEEAAGGDEHHCPGCSSGSSGPTVDPQ